MQFLTILKTILTLLPLLIETVRVIEAAMPQGGNGAAKLGLIRETIQSAFTVATDTSVQFEALWPAIQSVVGAIVSMFNTLGEFRK